MEKLGIELSTQVRARWKGLSSQFFCFFCIIYRSIFHIPPFWSHILMSPSLSSSHTVLYMCYPLVMKASLIDSFWILFSSQTVKAAATAAGGRHLFPTIWHPLSTTASVILQHWLAGWQGSSLALSLLSAGAVAQSFIFEIGVKKKNRFFFFSFFFLGVMCVCMPYGISLR